MCLMMDMESYPNLFIGETHHTVLYVFIVRALNIENSNKEIK